MCPAPNSEPALAVSCQGAFHLWDVCCEFRATRVRGNSATAVELRGFNTPSPLCSHLVLCQFAGVMMGAWNMFCTEPSQTSQLVTALKV